MIADPEVRAGSEPYCHGAHDATLRHRPPDVKYEPRSPTVVPNFGPRCRKRYGQRVPIHRRLPGRMRPYRNTSAPMGPWMVTKDEVPDPQNLPL